MMACFIGMDIDKSTDIIIIGAGLTGLVAAAEATDAGRRVIILDQEPEASLGGQAFWGSIHSPRQSSQCAQY
jgi:predicted oxidoreductase